MFALLMCRLNLLNKSDDTFWSENELQQIKQMLSDSGGSPNARKSEPIFVPLFS